MKRVKTDGVPGAKGGSLRPLRPGDAERLQAGFSAMGWSKPASVFEGYLTEQSSGARWIRVAEVRNEVAGYVTLLWSASDPELRSRGVPEIMDLNVLSGFRGLGLGNLLLESAEAEAARRGPMVGLRVGLHSGYGAAQRLYVRRGYIPDGAGVVRDGQVVVEGAMVSLDDDLTLRLTKEVSDPRSSP